MDCKEFEKMIPAFLANTMDYRELKRFMEHVDNCPDCKEELTIQVLVSEGMVRLEEGSAFDLQKELDRRMQEAEKQMRMHNMLKVAGITLELAAFIAVAIIVIIFVL
ncbi:MAG: zf-HC2 domain-containing protein [Lachnospiraceae bacterium]